MSAENVAVVKSAVEAFRSRDAGRLRELFHEDAEWRSAVVAGIEGGDYRGHADIGRYLADLDEAFDEWHTEDERYYEAPGERVVLLYRIVGRGRGSGVPIDRPVGIVFNLREERIAHGEIHLEPAEALKGAGLGESDYVAAIHEMNDAIATRNMAKASGLMDPDVVWEHNIGVGCPEEGVYRGRESVVRLFERILESWHYLRPVDREVREIGNQQYLVKGELHAKHPASETELVTPYEQVLEIRGGTFVKGRMTAGLLANNPGTRVPEDLRVE